MDEFAGLVATIRAKGGKVTVEPEAEAEADGGRGIVASRLYNVQAKQQGQKPG